jgi:hypothetical protein
MEEHLAGNENRKKDASFTWMGVQWKITEYQTPQVQDQAK